MAQTACRAIPCWKRWCTERALERRCAMNKQPAAATELQPKAAYSNGPVDAGVEELVGQIQDLMWNEVGIVRTRLGMQKAIKSLEEMSPRLAHPKTRRGHEAANLHLIASAGSAVGTGTRREPWCALPHGLSRPRRQEIPQALRCSGRQSGVRALNSPQTAISAAAGVRSRSLAFAAARKSDRQHD